MAPTSLLSAAGRRLEGKVALITGGASGIGECTARLFAQQGAKVVIADIQDDLGHSVARSLGPSICSYVHCNVSNESQIINAVDQTVASHGKLDVMFNNAGVSGAPTHRTIDHDVPDFERTLAVNTLGVFLGMKHASRVMIPARAGSIISTASLAACLAGVAAHGYTASKHAVVGLTKNAAAELGRFGIRVNCVSPFGVATPLATRLMGIDGEQLESMANLYGNLKGLTLKAQDVANAALYLASDEARYISGVNLPVDGGLSVASSPFTVFQYDESSS